MCNLCRSGKPVDFQAAETSSKEDVDYQPAEKKRRGRPPKEERKVEEEVWLILALDENVHLLLGTDWSCAVLRYKYSFQAQITTSTVGFEE